MLKLNIYGPDVGVDQRQPIADHRLVQRVLEHAPRSSTVLRDIVPGFAENANCPIHVVVSHKHIVSVVR